MRVDPFLVAVCRGAILDDLELDFDDGRGPIGFARMTPDQQAAVLERVPPRTVYRCMLLDADPGPGGLTVRIAYQRIDDETEEGHDA